MNFQIGLHLSLLAITVPKSVIRDSDDIRISITTMPDEVKENFSIKGKKVHESSHIFSLNITNITDKIVIVFRKKTFLKDNPIIASTTINLKEFPEFPKEMINEGTIKSSIKTVNVYYPLQKQMKEEKQKGEQNEHFQRKILGEIRIQMAFSAPLVLSKEKKSKKLIIILPDTEPVTEAAKKEEEKAAKIGYCCSEGLLPSLDG